MRKYFKHFIGGLLLAASIVSCTKDDDSLVGGNIDISFTAVAPDGTELVNADDALNKLSVGDIVTFTDSSTGSPQSVTWTLSSSSITKEIVARSGVGTCTLIFVGDYDLTVAADGQNVTYKNYITVVGGGTPEATVVDPMFTASVGGVDLSVETDESNEIYAGRAITLTDTSVASGYYEGLEWAFTNTTTGNTYSVEATESKSSVTFTPTTGGVYDVTFTAGGYDVTYSNFLDVTMEYLGVNGFGTDFEDTTIGAWGAMWEYAGTVATYSTAQAYGGSGNSSFFTTAASTNQFTSFLNTSSTAIAISTGEVASYDVSFMIYITSLPTDAAPSIDVAFGGHTLNYGAGSNTHSFDSTTPLNEWFEVTLTEPTTSTSSITELMFRIININSATPFEFYMDDLKMVKSTDDGSGDDGTDGGDATGELLSDAGNDGGFEDSGTTYFFKPAWYTEGTFSVELSTDKNNTTDGATSSYFKLDADNSAWAVINTASTIAVEAGETYTLQYYVYVPSGQDEPATSGVWGLNGLEPNYTNNAVTFPTEYDKWVLKSTDIVATFNAGVTATQQIFLSIDRGTYASKPEFEFYIDDITLIKKE